MISATSPAMHQSAKALNRIRVNSYLLRLKMLSRVSLCSCGFLNLEHGFIKMPILPNFLLMIILMIKHIVPGWFSGKLTGDSKAGCYSATCFDRMRVIAVTDGNEPPFFTVALCSSGLKSFLAVRLCLDFTVFSLNSWNFSQLIEPENLRTHGRIKQQLWPVDEIQNISLCN
ncbi:hypothetical protein Pan54_52300 [Rubinisphaera italica]|uniref:Uncharacterized protein n=1 Tax=Rubinisphaera italica TaxID=2527969 RepID=A0A5C5XMP0_9PLAN|nr:hypothetical protein Pan54_52300 [Rubinisphaera italica]